MTIGAGTKVEAKSTLFAGAKEWDVIKRYEDEIGVQQFVDSIDWGWFFFLTKPIFIVLHWLNLHINNMGWSIIGLTLIIKAILFPLAYKSYVSMARMKELQPEMEKGLGFLGSIYTNEGAWKNLTSFSKSTKAEE